MVARNSGQRAAQVVIEFAFSIKESFLMTTRKGPVFLALLFAVALSLSAFGQGRRNQQQQQPQQQVQAAQQGVGPVPQSKDEWDAFQNLQKEQAPDKKVELAQAFVAKYPNSDFVQYAHSFSLASYSQLGKYKEAVAEGEESINAIVKFGEKLQAKADADSKLSDKDKEAARKKDKNVQFIDKESAQYKTYMSQSEYRILQIHQAMIQFYQQLNDAPKMMEWGEKALGFKPDDITTLTMISNVMAERPPTNEEEKSKQMKRAEELANQALTQLPTFLAGPEAANLSTQGKADLTSQLHYTLGLVYLQQKPPKLSSSEQELLTALMSKPNDPVTYYRLGIAYVQDMKDD